uniref:Uncharacterized protein n=1 Tax=Mycena chlorophos TaxID=658473 RepID=A0ABQ0LAU0_MYCCL|nr:predicted protein [Mycena chlorophos]
MGQMGRGTKQRVTTAYWPSAVFALPCSIRGQLHACTSARTTVGASGKRLGGAATIVVCASDRAVLADSLEQATGAVLAGNDVVPQTGKSMHGSACALPPAWRRREEEQTTLASPAFVRFVEARRSGWDICAREDMSAQLLVVHIVSCWPTDSPIRIEAPSGQPCHVPAVGFAATLHRASARAIAQLPGMLHRGSCIVVLRD